MSPLCARRGLSEASVLTFVDKMMKATALSPPFRFFICEIMVKVPGSHYGEIEIFKHFCLFTTKTHP